MNPLQAPEIKGFTLPSNTEGSVGQHDRPTCPKPCLPTKGAGWRGSGQASLLEARKERSKRAARETTCRCGQQTLTGDNHDFCSIRITVNAEPASWAATIAAHLAGEETAELINGELHANTRMHLTVPPRGTHHIAHRCEGSPQEGLF